MPEPSEIAFLLVGTLVNLAVFAMQYKLKAEMTELKLYMHLNFMEKGM